MSKIKAFLEESKQEFRHINWPTFAETRRLTLIVIGFSLGISIFLGLLDIAFKDVLALFL